MAREIVRLSEAYLDGTLKLSLAADNRALSLSGMLGGATAVLVGIGLTYLFRVPPIVPLGVMALCCGGIFFCALVCAVRSVRPRAFNILGTLRSNWSDAEIAGPLSDALMSLAEVYERQALENVATLSKNADRLALSLRLFTVAIPISALAGILTYGLMSNH
jgi:hypothetical protein